MDTLNTLAHGGIAVLVVLLMVFEIRERHFGPVRPPQNDGYEYYTANGNRFRIRHVFGSLYKVYVFSECPVSTKEDRFGAYFTIRARSTMDAEYVVDGIYRTEEAQIRHDDRMVQQLPNRQQG